VASDYKRKYGMMRIRKLFNAKVLRHQTKIGRKKSVTKEALFSIRPQVLHGYCQFAYVTFFILCVSGQSLMIN
jgi:hypothetical protein